MTENKSSVSRHKLIDRRHGLNPYNMRFMYDNRRYKLRGEPVTRDEDLPIIYGAQARRDALNPPPRDKRDLIIPADTKPTRHKVTTLHESIMELTEELRRKKGEVKKWDSEHPEPGTTYKPGDFESCRFYEKVETQLGPTYVCSLRGIVVDSDQACPDWTPPGGPNSQDPALVRARRR